MNRLFLCLLLLSITAWTGCSTPAKTARTEPAAPPQITSLGKAFTISLAADSWPRLVKKAKPTFSWNGQDMLWIQTNAQGQPRFVLDEAYTYQPTNAPLKWVLLNPIQVGGNVDDPDCETPRFFYSSQNLHAVAELKDQAPPMEDSGDRGTYAVALNTAKQFGTVYEIGWQREMSRGVAHPDYGRRIYVLHDTTNQWHFLGEGPEEGAEHGGSDSIKSRVIWESGSSNSFPLQIRFHEESFDDVHVSEVDTNPGLTTYEDYALAGHFPASLQTTSPRSYLITEPGDTMEKITFRLACNWPCWNLPPDEKTLNFWRTTLRQLNPALPAAGNVPPDTTVQILDYSQVIDGLR